MCQGSAFVAVLAYLAVRGINKLRSGKARQPFDSPRLHVVSVKAVLPLTVTRTETASRDFHCELRNQSLLDNVNPWG